MKNYYSTNSGLNDEKKVLFHQLELEKLWPTFRLMPILIVKIDTAIFTISHRDGHLYCEKGI